MLNLQQAYFSLPQPSVLQPPLNFNTIVTRINEKVRYVSECIKRVEFPIFLKGNVASIVPKSAQVNMLYLVRIVSTSAV